MRIAPSLEAEIVSVDSMVVYRGMDVGTAKPTEKGRARVRHHLLDLVEPSEPFSVVRFQQLGNLAISDVWDRGFRPLLVGGSGLYFRALVDRLEFPGTDPDARAELEAEAGKVGPEALYERLAASDPIAAGKIEPGNVRRTVRALEVTAITGRRFSSFAGSWDRYDPERVRAAGVRIDGQVLAARIESRVQAMVAQGFVEEVGGLVARGFGAWLTATQAIGYAELSGFIESRMTLEEAVTLTVRRTKALARRQTAWFRRDPRIRWFDAGAAGAVEVADEIREFLAHG
jgi:tRNA dimethylallyltransferase